MIGIDWLRSRFERAMEWVVIALMVVLFVEVTVGVIFRMLDRPLVWYDELASVLLAWLTYYGAALAAYKRAHIGFPGLVRSLRPGLRLPVALFGELLTISFFVLLAWVGASILDVLATDYLVSLPDVSVMYTQSVIPIGASLYIVAELLVLPEVIAEARGMRVTGSDLAEKLH